MTARTSFADLVRLYGRANLTRTTLIDDQGKKLRGVVLFSRQPERRVEIAWSDPASSRYPEWARVRGERGAWGTVGGLALGARLKDLEKMNGRAFSLWGFEWTDGGLVRSWNGGNLADELKGHMGVRLRPARGVDLSSNEYRSVVGRRVLPSGDPILRKLEPRVTEIILYFPQEKRR